MMYMWRSISIMLIFMGFRSLVTLQRHLKKGKLVKNRCRVSIWPMQGVWMISNMGKTIVAWWRHQMETFSALLALCAVPGEFPAQRPVTLSFDVFFDLRLNKRLSKESWGWWFETQSGSLWRHCNVLTCPKGTGGLVWAYYKSPKQIDSSVNSQWTWPRPLVDRLFHRLGHGNLAYYNRNLSGANWDYGTA